MIKTVGCCDSGLGGFLVADALHKAYPKLDIVYIADQSNVPYGDKSVEQLRKYAKSLLDVFKEKEIKDVVVACNTLCANVIEDLREEYAELNICSIIEPTVAQLKNNYSKIGVLATQGTVNTHAYKKIIHRYFNDVEVVEIAAPKLVPVIENGCDPNELRRCVEEYMGVEVDAFILGCTHFPMIRPFLKDQEIDIYDSNQAVVDYFKNETFDGTGKMEVYTSKDADKMHEMILKLFHQDILVNTIQLKQSS